MIRQATIHDIDILVPLFEGYRDFYKKEPDATSAKAFLSERIERNESVVFLVLDETGNAVGFTQLYPLFSSTRMKKIWLLNDLFVTPSARGKGFSKALLHQAKQLAYNTDACEVMLETAKSNDIGKQLYPSQGFELSEDFNWYYWSPTA